MAISVGTKAAAVLVFAFVVAPAIGFGLKLLTGGWDSYGGGAFTILKEEPARGREAPGAIDPAIQAAEVRQMLEAKAARRRERGGPEIDIEPATRHCGRRFASWSSRATNGGGGRGWSRSTSRPRPLASWPSLPAEDGANSLISAPMPADPEENLYEVEELLVQPGTYFNPQTEVVVIVDDSASIDQEVFNMEAYEGAEWVRLSDEVPIDEDGRDRVLEAFQTSYHPGSTGSVSETALEQGDDELDEDEDGQDPGREDADGVVED